MSFITKWCLAFSRSCQTELSFLGIGCHFYILATQGMYESYRCLVSDLHQNKLGHPPVPPGDHE